MPKNLISFFNTNFMMIAFITDTIVKMAYEKAFNTNGTIAVGILVVFLLVVLFYSRKLFKDTSAFSKGLLIVVGVAVLLSLTSFLMMKYDLANYSLIANLFLAIIMAGLVGKAITNDLTA